MITATGVSTVLTVIQQRGHQEADHVEHKANDIAVGHALQHLGNGVADHLGRAGLGQALAEGGHAHIQQHGAQVEVVDGLALGENAGNNQNDGARVTCQEEKPSIRQMITTANTP